MKPVGDGSPRAAYAWLSRACEPGNRALWAYVGALGAVEVAAQLRAGDGPQRLQRAVGERAGEDRSLADLQSAERSGARLLTPEDDEWPTSTLEPMAVATAAGEASCVPPLAMWVRGETRLDRMLPRAVAVVGARAATSYGEYVANEIAYGLCERQVTIVSGGAFGIDAAAHRAALSARAETIAVLGCGIDRAYPRSNERLLEEIARSGALISEFPPGASPMRQRFLIRNRLIAGLTLGTVVVEAALRSGARSTAARAREIGKVVMAVPGPITSSASDGCLQMLREEAAIPVGTAAHVLDAVGPAGVDVAPDERGEQRRGDDLDPALARLLDAVPARRAAPVESIAGVAAASASEALRGLAVLELNGYVEQYEGRWRLRPD